MSRLSQKQTLDTIGGPLLIDWSSYKIAVPFVVVFSILVNANLLTPSSVPQVIFIAVASTTAAIAWAYIFDKTFFSKRDQNPIAIPWVVIFGLGLGITKGLSIGFMLMWFGIDDPSTLSILQRSLSVGTLALIFVVVTPLIENTRIEYQARRDSLVASLVKEELDKRHNHFDDSDLEEIAQRINQIRSSTSASEASERLRNLVKKVIRPQSHKLWKKQNSRFPNYSFRELVSHALVNRPFNPVQSSILSSIGVFVFSVLGEPVTTALSRTAILWVIVFVLYAVASQIKITTMTSGAWLFGLVVLLSSLIGTFASVAVVGEPFFELFIVTFLVYFSWQLLNTLVVAGVRTTFASSKLVDEELEKLSLGNSLDYSVREIVGRLDSRELADHLHSTVQNQVLATSLRLEKHDISQEEIASELDLLVSLLESSFDKRGPARESDLETELEQIKARWQGFIEIDYNLAPTPPHQTRRIQQILEEAISNAVRHGHAETIEIDVTQTGENTLLSVSDDGFGPREGKPGLGTSLFETSSLGRWKFEAIDGGGSRLIVLL